MSLSWLRALRSSLQINNNYCGNSVGISCSDNSTQNCIVDDSDFEVENGLVLAIFAIPIASVALIICIIVLKVRIVLKKKAVAQNVAPSNELPPIATPTQSQPMQIQDNIVQQNHSQPTIQIENTKSKYKVNQ